MNIFISWSGERSLFVARALRDFVPAIIQRVSVIMSADDIKSGAKWMGEVFQAMDSAQVAIICLTRDNVQSPWISFEAGALVSRGPAVIPYLIDIPLVEISGPLAAFQAVTADRDGTFFLLNAINKRLEQPLKELLLQRVFDAFWPQLEQALREIPESPRSDTIAQSKVPMRSERDLLEEILMLIRADRTRHEPDKGT